MILCIFYMKRIFPQVYISMNNNIPQLKKNIVYCNMKVGNVPIHNIKQCVILRPIDKRNTRTFLNRGLLRFYNWYLNEVGMQYRHVQRGYSCAQRNARVHPRITH